MQVLFQNRPDTFTKTGGDTIQMLKTKEGLERLGVLVDVSLDPVTDYRRYDLVHLFNVQAFRETGPFLERAKAAGKPAALSTIWWRTTELEINRIRRPQWSRLRRAVGTRVAGALYECWMRARRPYHRQRSWLVHNADLLLPNSETEGDILRRDFHLHESRPLIHVVPNAVEATTFDGADPQPFIAKHGLQDFVLCAARIENRKNQLNLLHAMKEVDAPLVLIGQPNPSQEDYVSLVQAAANQLDPGRVRFVEHMTPEQLASAYAAAKVHVLPSWFESPGLASLEAAVAGCNIVTTDRAPVDEYFGDLAWRCDPSSVRSIRDSIRAALAAPRSGKLREKIMAAFTWDRAAQETLKGYEQILGKR
jgi:glycosyltransferase involved in cell wall biosynthesis